MIWTIPKTNWNGNSNEYFNVFPDYARIYNNILFLQEYAQKIGVNVTLYPMEEPTNELLDPYVSFFNNVVYNIDKIKEELGTPSGYGIMRTYVELGVGWDYKDLNMIERNILSLKEEIDSIYATKEKLPFVQLGMDYSL